MAFSEDSNLRRAFQPIKDSSLTSLDRKELMFVHPVQLSELLYILVIKWLEFGSLK